MKISSWAVFLMVSASPQLFSGSVAIAAEKVQNKISLDISQGRLLTLRGPAATVFIADPSIADVQAPQPNKIFIFGKKTGRTTLYALSDTGAQIAYYDVDVHQPLAAAEQSLKTDPVAGDLRVKGSDSGVYVSGKATSAEAASNDTNVVGSYATNKEPVDVTRVEVRDAQVLLRCWVGEVNRSVQKDLGFNWNAAGLPGLGTLRLVTGRQAFAAPDVALGPTGGGRGELQSPPTDFGSLVAGFAGNRFGGSAVIDALEGEGLVTTLAEPSLIAMTGESASFLAGGQFPIPIAQGFNAVSITFQTYGVSLAFVPTVFKDNRINLKVQPEVSALSTQGEVSFSGATIPGLTVRRASTTVELGSGQSFAIAGLLQNGTTTSIQRYPWLGDIPVLGALFRSNSFQHSESELVIIITPYIVHGVDDPNRLKLPTDGLLPPNDIERIFFARMAAGSDGATSAGGAPPSVSVLTGPRLTGDAGFDLE